jgi:hypothetical protein
MIRVSYVLAVACALLIALPTLASQPSHASAILFLDSSGSMQETDPDCIRWEAVDLLLELMQNEDRAALFTFGTHVRDLSGGLVRLDEGARSQLRDASNRCVAREAYTDILATLREAERVVADLGAASRQAYPPTVVLLTDGVDDVETPQPDREDEIRQALESLHGMGARVFAVGLSGGADRQLLQEMKDRTDGEIALLERPEDLLGSFFRFSRELAGRWSIWEGSVDGKSLSVDLPAWAQEITAIYIPAQPTSRGAFRTATTGASVATEHYRVLKFQANTRSRVELELPPGPGHVILDGSGDLVLAAPLPARIPRDVPFQMLMEIHAGEDEELAPAAFLDHATARLIWKGANGDTEQTFLYDDGMHDDGEAADGVFGGRMAVRLNGEATYTAEVKAPYSRPLQARGEATIVGNPLMIDGPGAMASALSGAGSELDWNVANDTDVDSPVRVEYLWDRKVVGQESFVLPPGGRKTFSQQAPRSWMKTREPGVRVFVGQQADPVFTDERTVWPLGWLAVVILALLSLLVISLFFPRRSASGATLNVYHYGSDRDADPPARFVRLTGNGPVMGIDVPAPFDDPGTFNARSGMWRRGVKFVPAPGMVPRFSGHRPRRSGDGWIIQKTATWTVDHDGQQAKYIFKSPR